MVLKIVCLIIIVVVPLSQCGKGEKKEIDSNQILAAKIDQLGVEIKVNMNEAMHDWCTVTNNLIHILFPENNNYRRDRPYECIQNKWGSKMQKWKTWKSPRYRYFTFFLISLLLRTSMIQFINMDVCFFSFSWMHKPQQWNSSPDRQPCCRNQAIRKVNLTRW